MNHIFDLRRFENYLKRDFLLHRKLYLYMLAFLVGGYLLSVSMYFTAGFSLLKVIPVVIPICIMFSPCFFEKNITKYNGIFDFTFPVSNFERFLILLFRHVIVIPLLLYGVFFLLNVLAGLIPVPDFQNYIQLNTISGLKLKSVYALFGFQSLFLLGYLSFQRYAFIKTWLCIFIISFCMTMLLGLCYAIFNNMGVGMDAMHFKGNIGISDVAPQTVMDKIIMYAMCVIFPFGFWVVSYFKIREKEI